MTQRQLVVFLLKGNSIVFKLKANGLEGKQRRSKLKILRSFHKALNAAAWWVEVAIKEIEKRR